MRLYIRHSAGGGLLARPFVSDEFHAGSVLAPVLGIELLTRKGRGQEARAAAATSTTDYAMD